MENEIVLLVLGVLGLWFGSDIAVEYARKIADSLHISTLIVGLTVTSIGTSLGEITTNVVAGLHRLEGMDTSGIAIGTIIGSNISLITFVLGFCGLFTVYYLKRKKSSMRRDWYMLFFALGLMFLFAFDDQKIDKVEGATLIIAYLGYIFLVFRQEKVFSKVANGKNNKDRLKMIFDLLLVFIGVIGVIYSANIVIDNGIVIANIFKIDPEIIGLLIGFSSSLPELTISMHSILRGSHGLSLGNLIGGSITDPTISLGAGAIIAPVFVTDIELSFDMPFMLASTLMAWLFFMRGGKLDKAEASILIGMYVAFVYLKFFIVGAA